MAGGGVNVFGQTIAQSTAAKQAIGGRNFLDQMNTQNGGKPTWECTANSTVANPDPNAAPGAAKADWAQISTDCHDTGDTPDAVKNILANASPITQAVGANGSMTLTPNNVGADGTPHPGSTLTLGGAQPTNPAFGFSTATATAGASPAPAAAPAAAPVTSDSGG